jgi:hypothetical protein
MRCIDNAIRSDTMPMQILSHTPTWVFVVLALIVWVGSLQLVTRHVRFGRVVGVATAMVVLGIFGVATAFGDTPVALAGALLAGVPAAAAVALLPLPAGTEYDAARRRFRVPGSAMPLLLMAGLFSTKYAVGVALALHPELRAQLPFAIGVSALYGVFSGLFAGRALRLVGLARCADLPQAAAA